MFRFRNKDAEVVGKDELVSKEGWRLCFMGNSPATWKLLYAEMDKELVIAVEGGVGGPQGVVWYANLSKISGWGVGGLEPLSKQERRRIGNNIQRGMRILKHTCKIV